MLILEVAPGLSSWAFGDQAFGAGERHELEEPAPDLVEAAHAAAAAGSLIVHEAPAGPRDVEPDEESLAYQAKVDEIRAELQPERDAAIDAVDAEARAAFWKAERHERGLYQLAEGEELEDLRATAQPLQDVLDAHERAVEETIGDRGIR